jgi:hypothetical protein
VLIDISTNVGKLRYRLGDFLDLPILPDEVYENALIEKGDNLREATILCGQYILASLAFGVHRKMGLLEVYTGEKFAQYKEYLLMVVKDPAFNNISPMPYSASTDQTQALLQLQEDFANNWSSGTQSQQMNITAIGGFTNGDTFGF